MVLIFVIALISVIDLTNKDCILHFTIALALTYYFTYLTSLAKN